MTKPNALLALACSLLIACSAGDNNSTEENAAPTEERTIKENKYPEALYSFKRDGLYGYMNYLGEVIIEPQFKFALNFSEDGLARINESNRLGNQFGFINKKGEVVITPQFPSASGFGDGLAVVGLSRKAGYINTKGEIEIEYQYATASIFKEGIAKVSRVEQIDGINTKLLGYIDKSGKEIIPINNKTLGDLREGLIIQRKKSKDGYSYIWKYFDKNGDPVITKNCYSAGEFYGGRAYIRFKKGDNWVSGFMNKQGEIAIELPDSLESAGEGLTMFDGGHAFVRNAKFKYGVIDSVGNVMSPFIYDEPTSFSEGLALVSLNGLKGYIDYQGKMVIEAQFNRAFPFKNGFARVIKNDKYGIIDKTGNFIHEPTLANAKDFINGLALVKEQDGTTAYIDENGDVVLSPAGDAQHFEIVTME